LPLLDQPDRDQDQRPGRQAAQAQLAGDQPGLDGLAQPDLVGQDRAATHRPQRGPSRLELVAERLEPQPRQRHQRLGLGPRPHPDRLLDQHRGGIVDSPALLRAAQQCLVVVDPRRQALPQRPLGERQRGALGRRRRRAWLHGIHRLGVGSQASIQPEARRRRQRGLPARSVTDLLAARRTCETRGERHAASESGVVGSGGQSVGGGQGAGGPGAAQR